jgi:hypothetical protein
VQHGAGQEQTGSSTGKLAKQKEAGTRKMASASETLGQITVNTGETHPVVQRKEQKGYKHIAGKEAQAHLNIGHAILIYPARHTYKAYAADTGAYHAKGYKKPWRLSASTEEGIIIALGLCQFGEQEQKQNVKRKSGEYEVIGHIFEKLLFTEQNLPNLYIQRKMI